MHRIRCPTPSPPCCSDFSHRYPFGPLAYQDILALDIKEEYQSMPTDERWKERSTSALDIRRKIAGTDEIHRILSSSVIVICHFCFMSLIDIAFIALFNTASYDLLLCLALLPSPTEFEGDNVFSSFLSEILSFLSFCVKVYQ